ncbi:hypothetical protein J6590_035243 [Homalodisca vitripennis]|nr:hypothetical protein J6590_035243 [Homalodisca vitripennis]
MTQDTPSSRQRLSAITHCQPSEWKVGSLGIKKGDSKHEYRDLANWEHTSVEQKHASIGSSTKARQAVVTFDHGFLESGYCRYSKCICQRFLCSCLRRKSSPSNKQRGSNKITVWEAKANLHCITTQSNSS